MRHILLLFSIFIIYESVSAQEILSVNWQSNVSTNTYINHAYDIETDNYGNVYSLSSFPNFTNSFGQTFNESDGTYLITKQDSTGNIIYSTNFGGDNNFTFGDMEIDKFGNITIGVSFNGDFKFNNVLITSSNNWCAILLKLDSNLNIIWYVLAPSLNTAQSQVYITKITQDQDQSTYTSIQYIDSLSIDGTVYTGPNYNGYGFIISKFDTDGNHIWSKNYRGQSGSHVSNKNLEYHKYSDNIGTLHLSGQNSGDTLYINDSAHLIENGIGAFMSKITTSGNVQESIFVKNVSTIAGIAFLNERIFYAGTYRDTVLWSGNETVASIDYSAFIGELNQSSTTIDFQDLQSNNELFVTGFNISDNYGFVLSGSFDGNISFQGDSFALDNEYLRGGFITSFDQNYLLSDFKYILGGKYILKDIDIKGNNIYGTGVFDNNCGFENIDIFAWNYDVSVFRTTDLIQVQNFNPYATIVASTTLNCQTKLYPNPSQNYLVVNSTSSTIVGVYSIDGRIMNNIDIENGNNTFIFDLEKLSQGTYFINLLDCNGKLKTLRFNKIN